MDISNIILKIYENMFYVNIVMLIAILSSFIVLIKKKKYDGAIALFIVAIVYIVFWLILKR